MRRVLTEQDRDLVLSYVAAEPEMSLFIAGDIETMGMEGQLCVWGLAKAASADEGLGAVILRYGDNFVVYSRDGDFDDAEAAASSQGAMVIAVATDKAWRGRGLATAVVAELCDVCLGGGLEFMSLFFENPVAARIYRRLGFCDVGSYAMLRPSAR